MTAIMGLLAVLAFLGWLTVYHVAAGVFCSGVIWALDFPVRRTMLGELAGPSRFGTAMALDSATTNLTRMLGPLAGGALMLTIGISGAYLASVACFGGAALLLLFHILPETARTARRQGHLPRYPRCLRLLAACTGGSGHGPADRDDECLRLPVSQHDPGDRQGRTRNWTPSRPAR